MRYTLMCIVVSILGGVGNAQNSDGLKIKGSFQDEPLNLVILNLEINYGLKFMYDKKLAKDIRITTSFSKATLDDALDKIFTHTNIDYEIRPSRTILLFTRNEKQDRIETGINPSRYDLTVSGTVKDQQTESHCPLPTL